MDSHLRNYCEWQLEEAKGSEPMDAVVVQGRAQCVGSNHGKKVQVVLDDDGEENKEFTTFWVKRRNVKFWLDRRGAAALAFVASLVLHLGFPVGIRKYIGDDDDNGDVQRPPFSLVYGMHLLGIYVFDLIFCAVAARILILPLYNEYKASTMGIVTTKVEIRPTIISQQTGGKRKQRFIRVLYSIKGKAYSLTLYLNRAAFDAIERFSLLEVFYVPEYPQSAIIHGTLIKAKDKPRRFLQLLVGLKFLIVDWVSTILLLIEYSATDKQTLLVLSVAGFHVGCIILTYFVTRRWKAKKLHGATELKNFETRYTDDQGDKTDFINKRSGQIAYQIVHKRRNTSMERELV